MFLSNVLLILWTLSKLVALGRGVSLGSGIRNMPWLCTGKDTHELLGAPVLQEVSCHLCAGALLPPTACCVYLYCRLLEEWRCLCAESNATGPRGCTVRQTKNERGSKMQCIQGKCMLQRSCEGDVWSPNNGSDNERHSLFIGVGRACPIQTTFADLLLRLCGRSSNCC